MRGDPIVGRGGVVVLQLLNKPCLGHSQERNAMVNPPCLTMLVGRRSDHYGIQHNNQIRIREQRRRLLQATREVCSKACLKS